MIENNAGGGRVKSEGVSGYRILKRSPGHCVATSLPLWPILSLNSFNAEKENENAFRFLLYFINDLVLT